MHSFLKYLIFSLLFLSGNISRGQDVRQDVKMESASYSVIMSDWILNKVRNASVAVSNQQSSQSSYGSGTYVSYKKRNLVLTAYHVIEKNEDAIFIIGRDEIIQATLIYADELNDVAILLPFYKISSRKTIPLKIKNDVHEVGTSTVYTGFPNGHDLLTIPGIVSGFSGNDILLHSYGWYGASGSCVFDNYGFLVGIVTALDINVETRIPSENIIYITPGKFLDLERLSSTLFALRDFEK